MKILNLFCLFCLFCLFQINLAGQSCLPNSLISVSSEELTFQNIAQVIANNKLSFKEEEVNILVNQIEICNNQLDIKLRNIEDKISNLSLDAQEIHKYKDMNSIRRRIKALKQNLKDSKENLKQNFSKTSQTGVYLVLLENINTYANKNDLVRESQQKLYPFAIKDLNGTSVKRLISVSNNDNTKDIIKSLTSGKVSEKKTFVDRQNFAQKYFLYVAQVNVSPFYNSIESNSLAIDDNALVIKLNNTNDYERILISKHVSNQDIEIVKEQVSIYLENITQENINLKIQQDRVLEIGEKEIKEIQDNIVNTEILLQERKSKIKLTCKQYNILFDEDNLSQSAQKIFNHLQGIIKSLDKEWYEIKQNEIIYKATITTIEGNPINSIAEESLKLSETLDELFNKISKISEKIIVEDFKVNSYEATNKIELYREIERIWVYPIPQADNTFKIIVFGKFKIKDEVNALLHANKKEKENKKEYFEEGILLYNQSKYEEAKLIFEKSISQENNSDAYYFIGRYYEIDGSEKNINLAKINYEKGIKNGDLKAYYGLGTIFLSEGEKEKAKEYFKKAINPMQGATFNNFMWQTNLGVCYDKGYGVVKDEKKAVELYEKAANQGYARAQTNLGNCYEYEYGVVKDEKKAVELYEKAANQGYARAQVLLGNCYEYGYGVIKDEKKAAEWYEKSANAGDYSAQYRLAVLYQYGKSMKQNYWASLYWYEKSANQGYPYAQYQMGVIYWNGLVNTGKDEVEAVKWFQKAANQGNSDAEYQMGAIYWNGSGDINKDEVEAIKWFQKAANQDNPNAQYQMGVIHANGLANISEDKIKAIEWYKKAANNGNADAQYVIGSFLLAIEKKEDAIKWLKKAANQGHSEAINSLKDIKL